MMMNKVVRVKMIKAMEFIARNLNDEEIFETWLMAGIADGDIPFGSLTVEPDDFENLEYYMDDETFADIMDTFMDIMSSAAKESGALYCDHVVSKPQYDDDEGSDEDESEI